MSSETGVCSDVVVRAFRKAGIVTIFGVAARQIALMSIYFAGNTRLPMVAGWHNLLSSWFARLHRRHRTPVNSILFVGLITLTFSLASLAGVKEQEAFQLQDNAATTFYALIYMVLFAIPLVAIKRFNNTGLEINPVINPPRELQLDS